eukprot:1619346-Pyramimonas_sp.AAC.1
MASRATASSSSSFLADRPPACEPMPLPVLATWLGGAPSAESSAGCLTPRTVRAHIGRSPAKSSSSKSIAVLCPSGIASTECLNSRPKRE